MTSSNPRSQNALVLFILAAITLSVAWVQFKFGTSPYLSYDEAWHVYLGKIGPAWKNLLSISSDMHPPTYYLLLRPFFLLGTDPVYARLLSMGATVLTIPLFYALLRKLRIAVPVALVTTIVLASSVSFLHLGVTIRQYSLAIFILLAAIWFWTSMLPISNSQPKRRYAVISLLLFAFAFTNLYAILFVTLALFSSMVAVMLLKQDARQVIAGNWREHSRWPEWTLFGLIHLAVLLWYYVGWVAHINAEAPNHVKKYNLAEGQSVVEYLLTALQREAALFTPLFDIDEKFVNAGLIAIFAIILWLVIHNLRQRNYLRATLAMTPMALISILAITGMLRSYPFGGEMRHQYVLFPFLLLLLPLALDAIWKHLPNLLSKAVVLAVILAITAHSTMRTLDYRVIGEAPNKADWQEAYAELFATAPDVPIMIPAYALFWTYTNRLINHDKYAMYYRNSYVPNPRGFNPSYQGWLTILMPWASYEEYGIIAEDGSEALLLKDSYRWLFDPLPDDLFYGQMQAMIEQVNAKGLRIFSPLNGNPPADQDELRAAVEAHGFTLTDFTLHDDALIWTIMLAQPDAAEAEQQATEVEPPITTATAGTTAAPGNDEPTPAETVPTALPATH